MEKAKAIELLNKALRCVQTDPRNCGECKKCENYATKEDGIEAIRMAISALEGNGTNVPTNSALDHIHNVVAEREYQRGYKQAKEEYDHKLTVIKNTIKDYYYIKGKEDGKADAIDWIPVSDRLPGEKINPNTHDFEEVLCSTTFGDVRAYKFGTPLGWKEPHFWNGPGMMDEYVLAWVKKPEPWKGVRYGTVI